MGESKGRSANGLSVTTPTRQHLVGLWLSAAVLLDALLVFAQIARSDLDDPDPARQRPGFLDASPLPQRAPKALAERADVVIVVAGTGACDTATIIDDRSARLARAYGLPAPREGGERVGYAIVDGNGNIRYRTLDPVIAGDLSEVDTILGAIQ